MPIKFGQTLDATIGIPKDDGSMEYMKLNGISSISETELVDDPTDDLKFEMSRTWHGEFKLATPSSALYYFFMHGNDLYLRFPKKLRRKKRRR